MSPEMDLLHHVLDEDICSEAFMVGVLWTCVFILLGGWFNILRLRTLQTFCLFFAAVLWPGALASVLLLFLSLIL